MNLTQAQQQAVDLAKLGKNIFLSGSAGTGKSFTIEAIKKAIPHIYITASTGIAAINIGGQTLHRWSGIKPGQETAEEVLEKLWWKKKGILKAARAVLVDEISMVSGTFMDLLDEELRLLRGRDEPFGGIQIIVVGDFLQLPPVGDHVPFCFESEAWVEANFESIKLTKIFRQEKDTTFIDFLTKMRKGKLRDADFQMFKEKCCAIRPYEEYVRLYPTNAECENINYQKLSELRGPDHMYFSSSTGDKYEIDWFFKNSLIQRTVDIRVGARVMMLTNSFIDFGVANGSTGTVKAANEGKDVTVLFDNGYEAIVKREYYPIERRVNGHLETVAKIGQIPLRLAYAITVHKSQGMSLEKVYCDFKKIFTDSQIYVALSRATNMEHLYVENFLEEKITFSGKALNFVNES